MSKPRVDPTFGISSVDVLILTERHPACRWREAQPGSCKERENLAGDAKGKGPSGANRKAESTDAPDRGAEKQRSHRSFEGAHSQLYRPIGSPQGRLPMVSGCGTGARLLLVRGDRIYAINV